jgi:hypothetical protein
MAEAEELRMCPPRRPLPPRSQQLYRRTGKRQEAHEHLTTATTMYREMGMRFWVEEAEVEMRALP